MTAAGIQAVLSERRVPLPFPFFPISVNRNLWNQWTSYGEIARDSESLRLFNGVSLGDGRTISINPRGTMPKMTGFGNPRLASQLESFVEGIRRGLLGRRKKGTAAWRFVETKRFHRLRTLSNGRLITIRFEIRRHFDGIGRLRKP